MLSTRQEASFLTAASGHKKLERRIKSLPSFLRCASSGSKVTPKLKQLVQAGISNQAHGSLDHAEACFEEAVAIAEEAYGITHHRTAMITLLLAKVCRLRGKQAEWALLVDQARNVFATGNKLPPGGSAGFWSLLY